MTATSWENGSIDRVFCLELRGRVSLMQKPRFPLAENPELSKFSGIGQNNYSFACFLLAGLLLFWFLPSWFIEFNCFSFSQTLFQHKRHVARTADRPWLVIWWLLFRPNIAKLTVNWAWNIKNCNLMTCVSPWYNLPGYWAWNIKYQSARLSQNLRWDR